MSVKFEKETIRNAPVPGDKQTDIVQKVSETLTGGKTKNGYLAVRNLSKTDGRWSETERVIGVS